MALVTERFDIWLAKQEGTSLPDNPQTVYPCLIISPDELNRHTTTVIIAPFIRDPADYPSRPDCRLADQPAKIALDQIQTIAKHALTKKLGTLPSPTQATVLDTLAELFAA